MKFVDKIRLFIPKVVIEDIEGQPFRFHQCSPHILAQSAQLVAQLAGCVSQLLIDKDSDVGHTIQEFEDGQTMVVNAISEGLADQRAHRRREAIETLVTGFLKDEHRSMLLGLIVGSLRQEFDRKNEAEVKQGIEEFDNMDIGPFVQFFMGMMKANGTVFGDLGKRLVDQVQEQMGGVVEDEKSVEEPVPQDSVG